MRKRAQDELLALPNVGPSIREDLRRLGVNSLATLAEQDADELYVRIGRLAGRFHDPCLWDTFAAIIDMAKGGPPVAWWTYTPLRKARQAKGDFPSRL